MTDHDDVDCGCSEYNELSRRQFVAACASVVGRCAAFPAWLPKVVAGEALRRRIATSIVSVFHARRRRRVCRMCVPFGDPAYYTARPTIAIPRPDATAAATQRASRSTTSSRFRRRCSGLLPAYHGDGSAGRARDGIAQQLALALRRAAVHGSRQAGRPDARHRVARPAPGERPADTSPTRRCAARHRDGLQKTLVGGPKTLPIADPANYTIGGAGEHADRATRVPRSATTRAAPEPVQVGRARRASTRSSCSQTVELRGLHAGERRRVSEHGLRPRAARPSRR